MVCSYLCLWEPGYEASMGLIWPDDYLPWWWNKLGDCGILPVFLFPWPQKQQTMMNINFLLGLHVQFSKLPGYYGPTKTTNLSNCSAPITSSTKCHKTADYHSARSSFRTSHIWIYDIFYIFQVYDVWLFLATYWWCPKVLHQNKMKNHLYMYACKESKDIYIYIYTRYVWYIRKKCHISIEFHQLGTPHDQQLSKGSTCGTPGNDHISQASNPKPGASMVNNMLVSRRVYVYDSTNHKSYTSLKGSWMLPKQTPTHRL